MFNKLKSIIQEFRDRETIQTSQLWENYWANVYHDSIRGNEALEKLPLNIGRWAGNYSFFYVLNRIMNDYNPKSIVEFGLGESTKFISTCIKDDPSVNHVIIEHDPDWIKNFEGRFDLRSESKIEQFNLVQKQYKNKEYGGYEGIEKLSESKFNLYILDGPFRSQHYSRIDIIHTLEALTATDEFIIIIDDFERNGEQETAKEVLELFKSKSIATHTGEYKGYNRQLVITSKDLKFLTSL